MRSDLGAAMLLAVVVDVRRECDKLGAVMLLAVVVDAASHRLRQDI